MIKLISFDFYNTLARFWPPLDTIQQSACRELGLNVSKAGIDEGYAVADVFFNAENARRSLSDRTEAERLEFFAEYEQILLKTAEAFGLPRTGQASLATGDCRSQGLHRIR